MQHLYEVVETSFKYPIKIWNHQFNRSKVMKPHWHDEIELIYCNQGSFELSVNGEKKFVNTKQLVLINSNSIHRLRFLEDQTKIITLLLSSELFDEFKLVQCEFDLSLIKDQEQLEQLIIYLGDHLDQETLVIHNRMMQIYELLLEECSVYKLAITKKKLPIIKQIVTYIEQHYDDELNLMILANHFHFSEVYLSRMFKEKTGITLLSYINKIRLNHAYNDLMNTSLTINEIALNHGFKNVKAFNKIFKEYYHDIPSKYRKG